MGYVFFFTSIYLEYHEYYFGKNKQKFTEPIFQTTTSSGLLNCQGDFGSREMKVGLDLHPFEMSIKIKQFSFIHVTPLWLKAEAGV